MGQYYRDRAVLITGGLGFIGSNLAIRLAGMGADVLIVDALIPEHGGTFFNVEPMIDLVRVEDADLRDGDRIHDLLRGREVIFNLAGQASHLNSMNDPVADLEINCQSQLCLLETCRREGSAARIVYASTRQVYGRPQSLPVSERHPVRPVDVNGVHKQAGELYHTLYGRLYDIPVTILRLTNTYGPRMRVRDARQSFLGWWIRQVLTSEEIQVFGSGEQLRDFTYIDDCVDALLLAASTDGSEGCTYNLGADAPISLKEVARLLVEECGSGSYRLVPFPADRKAIDIGDYHGDSTKLCEAVGWQPRVSFELGIARTLEYFREHGPSHYWNPRS